MSNYLNNTINISAEKTKTMILDLYHHTNPHDSVEKYVIYYCELSPNKNYWIIRCNTEKAIIFQQFEYMLVGVNAHLVNTKTGEIEIVGRGQNIDDYLQDKYDLHKAGEQSYVLIPYINWKNSKKIIKLKQWLQCSYEDLKLLSKPQHLYGLTSYRRGLATIQNYLLSKQIISEIKLMTQPIAAMRLKNDIYCIEQCRQLLLDYIDFIKNK